MVDSDKTVTNVTVKDAPVEMNDIAIGTALTPHGQVVQGTIQRGYIKKTKIENGTRYLQMINVKDVVPIQIQIGTYVVRVYCDNNKTECRYCTKTDHPCYNCPSKVIKDKKKEKMLQVL